MRDSCDKLGALAKPQRVYGRSPGSTLRGRGAAPYNAGLGRIKPQKLQSVYRATPSMLARYILWRYVCSVCLSVRLSQVGFPSEWLNISSRKQRHTIAQEI